MIILSSVRLINVRYMVSNQQILQKMKFYKMLFFIMLFQSSCTSIYHKEKIIKKEIVFNPILIIIEK